MRRWLFIKITGFGVTTASPAPAACSPVTVGGVFRSASGLGESARLNLAALQQAGIAHSAADLSASLLGSCELPPPEAPPITAGPGVLILHVSGPFTPYALRFLGREKIARKRIIAVWHWELPQLPDEWRASFGLVHEVWAPSNFVAQAVRDAFNGPVRIIPHAVTLPGAIDPAVWRRKTGNRFLAVSMFNMASGFERKNPLAAVAAFRRAFTDDNGVRLIIKMMNAQAWPPGEAQLRAAIADAPNIQIVTEMMDRKEIFSLLAAADTVLSLHRAEGFGLLAAEAMLAGVPVIATDWSATTDFLNAQNSCLVPYHLIPANDPQGNYHYPDQNWADPGIDAAAIWLRRLREDENLRRTLGEQARKDAAQFSQAAYVQRLREALSL